MPTELTPPNADRFGLASFADLLPTRDHIVGEDIGSFDGFHDGMMQSLAPITPYECVVAENLIAIEWELLQHRRMRDTGLRQCIREIIKAAVLQRQKHLYKGELEKLLKAHVADGGSADDWNPPHGFDQRAAEAKGEDLANRAISRDPSAQEQAYAEISALGLAPLDLMGEAYRSNNRSIIIHDELLPGLERRRREVKNDFDMLQRARPINGEILEG